MRKIMAILALSALSFSCQNDKGYYLSGTIDNADDGTKVYVSEISDQNRPERIDSTTVEDGEFKLDMKEVQSPNLSFLEFQGIPGNVLFISENKEINFEVHKDSLRTSEVNGGKENKALYEYLGHLKNVNQEMMDARKDMREAIQSQDTAKLKQLQQTQKEIMDNDKVYKKKMITENKDNFVSVMALTDLLRMQSYPGKDIQEMYDSLGENVQNSSLGKALKENLDKRSAVDIGAKAPNFSAPTPDGKELSLKDAMGKVTIIDFWASWCKPCRAENPNVVKIYKKYHDQGLNIIGVSLDKPGQKDKWLKAIKDDNLEWQHVSNLQFWQDPVARKYDIRAIPATYILDENGVIVDRNLRGDDLENKIKEMLNSK
ncbi:MAG: redoxin domain-containing protein [Salegentibacter sp.]